jgi:hypothetical protein
VMRICSVCCSAVPSALGSHSPAATAASSMNTHSNAHQQLRRCGLDMRLGIRPNKHAVVLLSGQQAACFVLLTPQLHSLCAVRCTDGSSKQTHKGCSVSKSLSKLVTWVLGVRN